MKISKKLIDELKKDEAYRGMPYIDSRGYPTVGYGTLLPITEEEATLLLKHRLQKSVDELIKAKPFIEELPKEAQEILFNMVYNLGTSKLLKFRKMFAALEKRDYCRAAEEMIDSRWYHQVKSRAKRLVERMRKLCQNAK